MRIFTVLYLIIASILLPISVSSEITIHGITVSSDDRDILSGVSVLLKSRTDSIYAGTMSDEKGEFSISSDSINERGDSLYVEFMIQGFRDKRIAVNDFDSSVPKEVVMEPVDRKLAEVVVKAYKKKLVIEPGKFVFNPKSVAHVAADARIMLKYVPLLTVNENTGEMTVGGRPVKLKINGRDSWMPPKQVLDELSGLKPEQFKAVEIITNPGSSVASTSNVAIVNIMFDFDILGVFSAYSFDSEISDHSFSPSISASGTIQRNKYSATLYLSGGMTSNRQKEEESYHYLDGVAMESRITDKTTKLNSRYGGINFDNAFFFKRKSFLSFGVNMTITKSNTKTELSSIMNMNDRTEILPTTINKIDRPIGTPSFGTYVAGRWNYDDMNSRIEAKVFYFNNSADINNSFADASPSDMETSVIMPVMTQNTSKQIIGVSAELAGTHYFLNDWGTLEYGYNYFHHKERSDLWADTEFESARLSRGSHAAYLSYQKRFGELFSIRLGAREEYYHTEISSVDQSQIRAGSDQWYFIPNVAMTFTFAGGRHQLSINGSEYIGLPRIDMLNPHKIWISENSYKCGNPDLRAMRGYSLSAWYSLYNDYSISFGCNRDLDQSHTSMIETEEKGIFEEKSFNSGHSTMIYASVSYNKLLFNGRWNVNASVGVGNMWSTYGEGEKLDEFAWSVSWRNTVLISHRYNLYAELNASYNSPIVMGYKRFYNNSFRPNIDFYITKKFKWGGSLRLSIYNLCMKSPDWENVQKDYRYSLKIKTFPINAWISFSYNLGNGKVTKISEKYSDNINQIQNKL